MARNDYLRTRCVWLASREIQRIYRGHIGKLAAKRRMEWQEAKPGTDRLKLGMRLIEDTKVQHDHNERVRSRCRGFLQSRKSYSVIRLRYVTVSLRNVFIRIVSIPFGLIPGRGAMFWKALKRFCVHKKCLETFLA